MSERDELHMSLYDIIPKIHNHTQEEIDFVRSFSDKVKIDYETIEDIVILTDTVEFFDLIIHTIRQYNTFKNTQQPSID